jgi:hypothetical protein
VNPFSDPRTTWPRDPLRRWPAAIIVVVLLAACATTTPLEIATGAVGPAVEGRLVTVRGTLAGAPIDDRPWGWKIHLDDGSGPLLVFVEPASNIDVSALRAGQRVRVTGTVGRYEQHTELLPRAPEDLQLLP